MKFITSLIKMAVKEIHENVWEILTSDTSSCNGKLEALQDLKQQFKPLDKIYSRLKLESLLPIARVSLQNKPLDKNFLLNYGICLISIIGQWPTLNSEMLYQLQYVFMLLKDIDENLSELLMSKLESEPIFQSDAILNASRKVIESTVLDWVENICDPAGDFLSNMAADSPKLFQTITSVLYEVLVQTCFNRKVLEVQKAFVFSVKSVCLKKGRNFLGLYPKGCCQLASLLLVPPGRYAESRVDIITDVVSLYLEMFFSNKKRALILLSHFPEWINVFSLSLAQTEV